MNILVINGSPKGRNSITLHTCLYLEKKFPAHRFIEDNCADMGLPFLDGLSADMDDILSEKGRKQAVDWLEFTLWKLSRGEFKAPHIFEGRGVRHLATVPEIPEASKDESRKAVIVTDLLPDDAGLKAMIAPYKKVIEEAS